MRGRALLCGVPPDHRFVARLLERDWRVVLVLDNDNFARQRLAKAEAAPFERIYRLRHFGSIEEVAAVGSDLMLSGTAIDRIVSFDSRVHYAAGLLGSMLKVDGIDLGMASRVVDEHERTRLLADAGIPTAAVADLPDSIEALWRSAQEPLYMLIHRPVAIAVRSIDSSYPVATYFVAPERHRALYTRALELHGRLNQALGVHHTMSHVEFCQPERDGDLCVADIATGAPATIVVKALEQYFDVSPFELWADALAGGPDSPASRRSLYPLVGTCCLIPSRVGVVVEMPTAAALLSIPGVLSCELDGKPGDRCDGSPHGPGIRMVLACDDEASFVALAARLHDEFAVKVAPFPGPSLG